jgi:hypothetical protein
MAGSSRTILLVMSGTEFKSILCPRIVSAVILVFRPTGAGISLRGSRDGCDGENESGRDPNAHPSLPKHGRLAQSQVSSITGRVSIRTSTAGCTAPPGFAMIEWDPAERLVSASHSCFARI